MFVVVTKGCFVCKSKLHWKWEVITKGEWLHFFPHR